MGEVSLSPSLLPSLSLLLFFPCPVEAKTAALRGWFGKAKEEQGRRGRRGGGEEGEEEEGDAEGALVDGTQADYISSPLEDSFS